MSCHINCQNSFHVMQVISCLLNLVKYTHLFEKLKNVYAFIYLLQYIIYADAYKNCYIFNTDPISFYVVGTQCILSKNNCFRIYLCVRNKFQMSVSSGVRRPTEGQEAKICRSCSCIGRTGSGNQAENNSNGACTASIDGGEEKLGGEK